MSKKQASSNGRDFEVKLPSQKENKPVVRIVLSTKGLSFKFHNDLVILETTRPGELWSAVNIALAGQPFAAQRLPAAPRPKVAVEHDAPRTRQSDWMGGRKTVLRFKKNKDSSEGAKE